MSEDQLSAAMASVSVDPTSTEEPTTDRDDLSTALQHIQSNDPDRVLHGTVTVRKLLSQANNPPIDEVIQSGVVANFVHYLGDPSTPDELRFEVLWAVTNVASGTQENVQFVLQSGAAPVIIPLFSSPSSRIRDQAAWAIGNLAGDGVQARDYCLTLGAMPAISRSVELIESVEGGREPATVSEVRNTIWCLCNLLRLKPIPEVGNTPLPSLASLLHHSDSDVVADALWSFVHVSDGSDAHIAAVVSCGALRRLTTLMISPNTGHVVPALRTLGNLAAGPDSVADALIESGVLPSLHFLLHHRKDAIRKESLWLLSNILAGNASHVESVLRDNLLAHLLNLATSDAKAEVRREGLRGVVNLTENMTFDQGVRIHATCGHDVVRCLVVALSSKTDKKLLDVALQSLECLMNHGKLVQERNAEGSGSSSTVENPWVVVFNYTAGAHEALEALKASSPQDLSDRATKIICTHLR